MTRNDSNTLIILLILASICLITCSAYGAPVTGTLSPIGRPGVHQWEPAISGDRVVWRDDRTGNEDIFLYNITSGAEKQITSGSYSKENPVISGHYIAWQDDLYSGSGNGFDIVLYDLNTGITKRIANETGDQINPSIDGDIVAWQDYRSGGSADIYLYSISLGTETRVTDAGGDQLYPRVSDNRVVWENDTFWPRKVMMYDYAGNRTPFQPVDFGFDEDQLTPSIRGDQFVWTDNHKDLTYYRAYKADLSNGEILEITPDDNDHAFPDVDGDRVVWNMQDDVYINDTAAAGSETAITETFGATSKENIRISGNRIVWRETDGANDMIYLFTIGSPELCPEAVFTIHPSQSGGVPFTAQFSDASENPPANPITHWNWEFGEGNTSTLQNPSYTYRYPGDYDVRLTVSNQLCRNTTLIGPVYHISAGVAPVAHISPDTTAGMVPLTVTFTDTSAAATAWNWSFGDSGYGDTNPVTHTFTSGGTYLVRLNSSNEYGYSRDMVTIRALTGADQTAGTEIDGIYIDGRYGGQFLVFNGTTLPGYTLSGTTQLTTPPLTSYGWSGITFHSSDSPGFHDYGNHTIMGNLSGAFFQSTEIRPAGFSVPTGRESSVNFSLDLPSYPNGGRLQSQIWEGAISSDLTNFQFIAQQSGWSHILGIAYTLKETKTSFSPSGPAKIHMSVNSTWVATNLGRDHTYVIRIGDDNKGEVLPTRFLYRDPATNLDFFEADSSHGLSTFGLAQLAGSGNPLQLITLTIQSHVSPPSVPAPASDSGMPVTNQGMKTPTSTPTVNATPADTPVLPDPGTSTTVYTSGTGIVTREATLASADGKVTLRLSNGTLAKDAAGKPVTALTIRALLPGEIPPVPSGAAITLAGTAYEIGPDGATFTPPGEISFVAPQVLPETEYSVRSFDRSSGAWTDLPTTFDAGTGLISAEPGHFCTFALFTKPQAAAVATLTAAGQPASPPAPAATPGEPETPVQPGIEGILMSLLAWIEGVIINNVIPFFAVIVLGISGYLVMQGMHPGSGP